MDTLSHAVVGSLVADALPLSRRLGQGAQIAAIVAAISPDIDMLPAFIARFPPTSFSYHGLFASEVVWKYHRGYTHSLFVMLLAIVQPRRVGAATKDQRGANTKLKCSNGGSRNAVRVYYCIACIGLDAHRWP